MLEELIRGEQLDAATAEQALGYRLRQHHLGVVLWSVDQQSTATDLRLLERFLVAIGKALDADGQPLFFPRDRSTAWGWVPLGPVR